MELSESINQQFYICSYLLGPSVNSGAERVLFLHLLLKYKHNCADSLHVWALAHSPSGFAVGSKPSHGGGRCSVLTLCWNSVTEKGHPGRVLFPLICSLIPTEIFISVIIVHLCVWVRVCKHKHSPTDKG